MIGMPTFISQEQLKRVLLDLIDTDGINGIFSFEDPVKITLSISRDRFLRAVGRDRGQPSFDEWNW